MSREEPGHLSRPPSRYLVFTGTRQVEVRTRERPRPGAGQVRVQALVSAISAGTELLVYRGQVPRGMAVDASLPALAGTFGEPIQYGYALVGRVVDTGAGVDDAWRGRLVFAFHPHESAFCCAPEALLPVPDGVPAERAIFLANMETAVCLVHDGRPLLGERVAVLGQGVVGLLATALLARLHPMELLVVDPDPRRRALALELGATRAVEPGDLADRADHDLVYEISGNPAALDQAVQITGYAGRVVIGSWYGTKPCALHLGGAFHRSRVRLQSSQVSTIAPEMSGRWTKERRLDLAWSMLRDIDAGRLISHRFPLHRAGDAYALLDHSPGEAVQVLFTYDGS